MLLPMLLYAVYRRNVWVGVAAILFTVLNPVLFSPPETDDAWMTRVVRAEQWWTEELGRPVIGLGYPNCLNVLNIPLTAYAFLAAYRRQPRNAALAGVGAIFVKFWYVGELVRRYDAKTTEGE